jgi:membrane associated rhomboid family serine protease
MLIPIRHENMSAQRWPLVTFGLIAANVLIFLGTYQNIEQQGRQLREVKAHILMLAAMHSELALPSEAQQLVANFRDHHKGTWSEIQQPNREIADAWDARVRLMTDPTTLQSEMDTLTRQYSQLESTSITERYAFTPSHPRPVTYLTANFLHGGWLHLIGNMWFLWLAGFVLEDFWGRPLYAVFYLISGAAALQFHAWFNPGSIVPTLGASGAVAALMGAFLVRFPKMKIEMAWLFAFRLHRFKAAAYWLLPLWLLLEVFYGSLFVQASGVAHWAHVGGFVFGAAIASGLRYSGLEGKAHQQIEEEVSWTNDPAITQASELIDRGDLDLPIGILSKYLAANPNSVDACNLLRQIYLQKKDGAAYQEVSAKLCAIHLKAQEPEQAWQDYEDFRKAGGTALSAAIWLELCRVLEKFQNYERVVVEYEALAAAYPSETQSLAAMLGAARVCLKLNRNTDALKFFEQAGIHEAKAAMRSKAAAAAK